MIDSISSLVPSSASPMGQVLTWSSKSISKVASKAIFRGIDSVEQALDRLPIPLQIPMYLVTAGIISVIFAVLVAVYIVAVAVTFLFIISFIAVLAQKIRLFWMDRWPHAFSSFFKTPPPIPSHQISKVPYTILVRDPIGEFKKVYQEPKDLKEIIKFADKISITAPEPVPALQITEIFIECCKYLSPVEIGSLARTCKALYICYESDFFARSTTYPFTALKKEFSIEINECLFPHFRKIDQDLLYFSLCKKLCGHPVGYHRKEKPNYGRNLIRHLIECMGPFTFLSIPCLPNFDSPAKHPIERTFAEVKMWNTNFEAHIKLRFRMKAPDGTIYVQTISESEQCLWTAWPLAKGVNWESLTEECVNQLTCLIQNKPIPLSKGKLFRYLQNHPNQQFVKLALDPPLSSLKERFT